MSLLVDRLMTATLRRCDLGTAQGKVRFVRVVARHVGRIPDPMKRGKYLLRMSEMTGIDILTIRREAVAR